MLRRIFEPGGGSDANSARQPVAGVGAVQRGAPVSVLHSSLDAGEGGGEVTSDTREERGGWRHRVSGWHGGAARWRREITRGGFYEEIYDRARDTQSGDT